MNEIQKKRVRKLVEELRSGLWPQTTGQLHNQDGFCCLGVACQVAVTAGLAVKVKTSYGTETNTCAVHYDDCTGYLPDSVQEWYGFSSSDPSVTYNNHSTSLASLNDEPEALTLPQIAAVIEANFLVSE